MKPLFKLRDMPIRGDSQNLFRMRSSANVSANSPVNLSRFS